MSSLFILLFLFLLLVSCVAKAAADSIDPALIAEVEKSQQGSDISDSITVHQIKVPDTCEHKVKDGDKVAIHYTVKIHASSKNGVHGSVVDTSRGRSRPFKFKVGSTSVIAGLNEGIIDACWKERRVLVIPPKLAYGEEGRGNVPGGATLEFDFEVISIDGATPNPAERKNVFKEMDRNGDGRIVYEEMQWWFENMHPNKLPTIPIGVWEKDDRNMDGFISWEEFSGPKGLRREL